jgi:cytochrome c
MKKQILIAMTAMVAASAWAAGPEDAMNKAGCVACHAKDRKTS